eukprot:3423170-Pleurochrysis_carterae.AAC.1
MTQADCAPPHQLMDQVIVAPPPRVQVIVAPPVQRSASRRRALDCVVARRLHGGSASHRTRLEGSLKSRKRPMCTCAESGREGRCSCAWRRGKGGKRSKGLRVNKKARKEEGEGLRERQRGNAAEQECDRKVEVGTSSERHCEWGESASEIARATTEKQN